MSWLTKKETADEFGVDPRTVSRWLENGLPSGIAPSGEEIVNPKAVEAFLANEDADEQGDDDADDDSDDDSDED